MFNDQYCKGKLPNSFVPAMQKMIAGLLFIPIAKMATDYPITLFIQEPVVNYSLLTKFVMMYLIVITYRAKYYFAWFVAEGSCILTGLGYNGLDENGKPKWDRVTNVYFTVLEAPQNITMINAAWNVGTTKWLKKYIYNGLAATPGRKPGGLYPTVITYLTSAVWHGFYPGYYFFFISVGTICTELSKECRRYIRPYFLTNPTFKLFYDVVGTIITMALLYYGSIGFFALDFWLAIKIYQSFNWSVHIFSVVLLLYFKLIHVRLFVKKHSHKE